VNSWRERISFRGREMASAGTLLSDLDGKAPVLNHKDDDLVNKILADMNLPSPSNPVMNAAPSGRMIQDPNPNTTYPVSMDPATATAHMIGKDYPSPADFANMMHSPSYRPDPYAPIMSQQHAAPTLVEPVKNNMYADILAQIKQPLIVSLIVFLLSLPIIHVLIGHYVPSLLRIGGDLTTAGLVVKSLLGGFLFWFIQKVLVPLMVV